MSSFTTNNRTRRTKRARVQHTKPDKTSTISGGGELKHFAHNPSIDSTGRNKTLVDTFIGSHQSKGLTIIGGSAKQDHHHGTNVDERTDVPLGTSGEDDGLRDGFPNSNMAVPPYPISYTGPGYMKIMNPISIPNIIYPMHVKDDATFGGNVTINGSLTVLSATLPGSPFTPVIKDALGNELTGVVADSIYVSDTSIDYFELLITWTGVGALDPAEEMRLTGFPLTNYSTTSAAFVLGHGGVSTTAIGGQLHTETVPGADYIRLQEVDLSAGTPPSPVLGANFFSAGQIHMHGWMRKLS